LLKSNQCKNNGHKISAKISQNNYDKIREINPIIFPMKEDAIGKI